MYSNEDIKVIDLGFIADKISLSTVILKKLYKNGGLCDIEKLCAMIEIGVPIEPFIIGLERWEKIQEEREEQKDFEEKQASLLYEEISKNRKGNFPLNKSAYQAFLKHREDTIRKKVTIAGAKKQKALLRNYPTEIQHYIVEKAIKSRNEGLFHPTSAELSRYKSKIEREKEKQLIESNAESMADTSSFSVEEISTIFE